MIHKKWANSSTTTFQRLRPLAKTFPTSLLTCHSRKKHVDHNNHDPLQICTGQDKKAAHVALEVAAAAVAAAEAEVVHNKHLVADGKLVVHKSDLLVAQKEVPLSDWAIQEMGSELLLMGDNESHSHVNTVADDHDWLGTQLCYFHN